MTKKPGTEEEIEIFLYHFKGDILEEINNFDSFENKGHKVFWKKISKINEKEFAPNIISLKEKGELR